jgi:hypothetical protein
VRGGASHRIVELDRSVPDSGDDQGRRLRAVHECNDRAAAVRHRVSHSRFGHPRRCGPGLVDDVHGDKSRPVHDVSAPGDKRQRHAFGTCNGDCSVAQSDAASDTDAHSHHDAAPQPVVISHPGAQPVDGAGRGHENANAGPIAVRCGFVVERVLPGRHDHAVADSERDDPRRPLATGERSRGRLAGGLGGAVRPWFRRWVAARPARRADADRSTPAR